MFTDMVGYTALGQKNESLSLALVEEQRKIIRPILARHNGREIKTMGDAFLVEFPNALDAVRCAYDIQRATREFNISLPEEKRIHLRVGLHLGDIVESKGDVLGDAVNLASRIEPLAKDGGVCLTRQVYDHVQNKFELPLKSLGPKILKNVNVPVDVYEMLMPWGDEVLASPHRLDKKRIAVLPLANISPDPTDEYFAEGLTEELIGTVSKVQELRVISHTSVTQYKGRSKPIPEIGRELNAGTLLEGSVRKMGNRIRVSIQMIDANEDEHLWAENYDRTLEDVFAIQSEIASKISEELRVKLVDSDKRLLEKRPTESTQAYTHFLQGRELLRRMDEKSLRGAVELYRKAIELDPSFARAYSGLAECYLRLGNAGYEPYTESIARAKVPLKRALELDPNLAEAHATFSLLLMNEDDMRGLEAEARRAIELNPSLPEPYEWLANLAVEKEDHDEAVRLIETGYRLDPASPRYIGVLGLAYFYSKREGEALEHWKKTAELAPVQTYPVMAQYYIWKGDFERAKQLLATLEELDPNSTAVMWMRGFIAAKTGDRDAALREIRRIAESKAGATSLCEIGYIHYALGDLDSYFDYLGRALDLHALAMVEVMDCPLFAEGKTDPRYRALLDKMKKRNWPDQT
jgi:adenylate cyclase